jgi:hypothetical protein
MAVVQHENKSIDIKRSDALLRIIVSMLIYVGFWNLVRESVINCVSFWGRDYKKQNLKTAIGKKSLINF